MLIFAFNSFNTPQPFLRCLYPVSVLYCIRGVDNDGAGAFGYNQK